MELLKKIAADLATAVEGSAAIDWLLKESARAAVRSRVGRLLAKYDYPPGHGEHAVELGPQEAVLLAGASGGTA